MNPSNFLLERKAHVVGYLEELCATIELTSSQLNRIETSYRAVGDHLVDCVALEGFVPRIFPQGSVRLGTTVRPIAPTQHFDVDLICKLEAAKLAHDQGQVHLLVGKALSEHEFYKKIVSVLKRGWRLEYADSAKFHLDVTPRCRTRGAALAVCLCPTEAESDGSLQILKDTQLGSASTRRSGPA